jgi:hypothetical protein
MKDFALDLLGLKITSHHQCVCGVVKQLWVSWNPQFFSSYQCQAEGTLLPTHTYITVHPFTLT